jgi:hypothetical protein
MLFIIFLKIKTKINLKNKNKIMETCKSPSHGQEAAEQLTDMFECSPEMSKVVKERFNQIHSQEINEITLNTQSKLSKVL